VTQEKKAIPDPARNENQRDIPEKIKKIRLPGNRWKPDPVLLSDVTISVRITLQQFVQL
jgi:hypothetical protein